MQILNFRVMLIVTLLFSLPFSQTIIEISVKGISDGKNDGAQKDREEAIMDAKRQACEKAGLTIDSRTTVNNFKVFNDLVETQSKGILLPGFQIIDIGYVADGTYQVVLSGKIKGKDNEVISNKELRYAKTLRDKGRIRQCIDILEGYIDSKDEKVPEEVKEEAYFYLIKWGFAFRYEDAFDKFSSYYPESKHLEVLKGFLPYAQKPVCSLSRAVKVTFSQWKKASVKRDGNSFDRRITVFCDTLGFVDFKNSEHSIVTAYEFYQSTEKGAQTPFAYCFSAFHYDGSIKKNPKLAIADTVFDNFKPYTETDNMAYQSSRGEVRFGNFKLADCRLTGAVPAKAGEYPQEAYFVITQVGF
jgi:hypothetical protein